MSPTLSIITPTQGRATLERMLDSAVGDLRQGDEWLVVTDSHGMAPNDQRAIARRIEPYPHQVHTLTHDAGRHDWGHSQINHGVERARGDWLVFQDDDDVFTPGALGAIRAAVADYPARPLLFRFRASWGGVYWRRVGEIREGTIGGHCLVCPNVPGMVGRRTSRYCGDFDMIAETVARWEAKGVAPAWVDHLIAVARPKAGEVAA